MAAIDDMLKGYGQSMVVLAECDSMSNAVVVGQGLLLVASAIRDLTIVLYNAQDVDKKEG